MSKSSLLTTMWKYKKLKTFYNLKEKYVCVFLGSQFYTYVYKVSYKHLKDFFFLLLDCYSLEYQL